ncbi:MAG: hypothetical protein CfP315_0128 [Candidatus Improbicoccus pseudotrichonymphae]|uniref:Uncharacterized protein n=1 Tax=Candidatus Improbicoccus pseudotrichonymphae TaxID=3033792 RepID=A0AA48IA02_9FIRM|nr:MAG: hypothetical protein CfP315_0128 [Candidatus Improbicoccus pseudotrichonymphae]
MNYKSFISDGYAIFRFHKMKTRHFPKFKITAEPNEILEIKIDFSYLARKAGDVYRYVVNRKIVSNNNKWENCWVNLFEKAFSVYLNSASSIEIGGGIFKFFFRYSGV